MQTSLIQNAHGDLVTDAAYDFYGVRLATCSLDHRIKIWQLDESDGTWTAVADWKVRGHSDIFLGDSSCDRVGGQAHDAAVTKLSWAHPEFGSVLASSSFDRTVKVWEETRADNTDQPQANGASAATSGPGTRWVERAVLVDAKGSVRAVEFAPHQFGLKLVRSFRHVCHSFFFVVYRTSDRLRLLRTIICACMSVSKPPLSRTGR
jgi:nucleoporin SEH1